MKLRPLTAVFLASIFLSISDDLVHADVKSTDQSVLEVVNSIESLGTDDASAAIARLLQFANDGNSVAAQAIGRYYLDGTRVPKDVARGLTYLDKASIGGSNSSSVYLGDLYRDGIVVPADFQKAVSYYRRAADANMTTGKIRLAQAYLNGTGLKVDTRKALELLEPLSEDKNAFQALGDAYSNLPDGPNGGKAIEYYEKALSSGNENVLTRMGDIYRDGTLVPADAAKAFAYYQRAALQPNNVNATVRLGQAYITGNGVTADVQKGISLLSAPADSGNAGALQALGDAYSRGGPGIAVDGKKAVIYYEKADAAGSKSVLTRLGDLYRDGVGVTADPQVAVSYYRRSADANMATGKIRLAQAYLNGTGLKVDTRKALELLEPLSEDKNAFQALGDAYSNLPDGPNGGKAIEYYEKALSSGNENVLTRMGDIYRDGTLVPADAAKAFAYYQRAALQPNNVNATVRLGQAYITGNGVTADVQKGISLLSAPADSGNAGALQALGDAYSRGGPGIAVDGKKAVIYYEKADAAGSKSVLTRLGDLYRDGVGVTADPQVAVSYYRRSADANMATGKIRLAQAYVSGAGVEPDVMKGLAMLEDLSGAGDVQATQLLGDYYSRAEYVPVNIVHALDMYERAAASGNISAMMRLGEIYRDGLGTKKDAAAALRYFKQASAAGSDYADVLLARGHMTKQFGSLSRPTEALKTLKKLSSRGNEAAAVEMANIYLWGRGVAKSQTTALDLLRTASKSGNLQATRRLLALYRDGINGVIARQPEAARRLLDQISDKLTSSSLMREKVLLAASSARRTTDYEAILGSLGEIPEAARRDALMEMKNVNANAFVFVVQKRMKAQGLYSGPDNGLLTADTIQAIRTLCGRSVAAHRCEGGPLDEASVRVVSRIVGRNG